MSNVLTIDLNADLGEFSDEISLARDTELMRYVTSANVACGGHTGDENTIRTTVLAAKAHGVAVGAHPSYPDRENFGRIEMAIAMDELKKSVTEQIVRLIEIALQEGVSASHVKPHGALYHSANKNTDIARMIAEVVLSLDRNLVLVGQSGSTALGVYRSTGLRTVSEGFVDRCYESNGSLRNRQLPGSVLASTEHVQRQAVSIALRQPVTAYDGTSLRVEAETLCLHSDTPNAVSLARLVRERLISAGVQVRSFH